MEPEKKINNGMEKLDDAELEDVSGGRFFDSVITAFRRLFGRRSAPVPTTDRIRIDGDVGAPKPKDDDKKIIPDPDELIRL